MKSNKEIRCGSGTELPVITLFTGVVVLFLFFLGERASFLQYDRTAIASGEVWRCITGHWIHWSFDHFLWCAITFVALGCICERLSRNGYVTTIVTACCIIPAVAWFADAEMILYRGLSGLASAIFVFGAGMMICKTWMNRDWSGFLLSALAGFAYMGKILFEYASGSSLFVNSHGVFTPVPLAHFSGGVVGLAMVFIFSQKRSKQSFNAFSFDEQNHKELKWK